MELTQHQRKMLKQAERRLKETLSKDPSIISIEIPKDIEQRIDPSKGYAQQLAELTTVKVKTATPYGTSDTRNWKASEALPLVRAANKAEKENEKLKIENPEKYKELSEGGFTRRRNLGMIVTKKDPDYTKSIFSRSAEKDANIKEANAAANLKKSLEDPVSSVSGELWREIRKAINEKTKDHTLRTALDGSEIESGKVVLFFSSKGENIKTLLDELLKVLGIPLEDKDGNPRVWKTSDGTYMTLEEIAREL